MTQRSEAGGAGTSLQIETDQDDYAPGASALFTATGLENGASLSFQVLHVDGPGADGIYGTFDDELDDGADRTGGTRDDGYGPAGTRADHDPFVVTDGVRIVNPDGSLSGDLDGKANGVIVTEWFVNPDDSLNERFLLTARTVTAGPDGRIGTADDVATGLAAATTFTDGEASASFPTIFLGDRFAPLDPVPGVGEVSEPFTPGREVGNERITAPFEGRLPNGQGIVKVSNGTESTIFVAIDGTAGNVPDVRGIEVPPNSTVAVNIGNVNGSFVLRDDFGEGLGDTLSGSNSTNNNEIGTVTAGYIVTKVIDNPDVIDAAGQVVEYSILISSTGELTVSGIQISDPLLDPLGPPVQTGGDPTNNLLDPGETWLYSGSYTVQQSDIDDDGDGDGFLDNTVTVNSNEVPQATDAASLPIDRLPSITIEKTVTDVGERGAAANVEAAGDVITYQIDVTNTGNVTLDGVTVTDPLTGLENVVGSLAPDEVAVITDTYTVRQVDIDENGLDSEGVFDGDGDIDNEATVTAEARGGDEDLEQSAAAVVGITQQSGFSVTKTAVDVDGDGNGILDADGDVVTYLITVFNEGNTRIFGVEADDPLLGEPLTNPFETGGTGTNGDGILDPGETWTYTPAYTLRQEDLDAGGIDENGEPDGDGDIDNIVTVTADGFEPQTASAEVDIARIAGLDIFKTVTDVGGRGPEAAIEAAEEVISYEIRVDNTGNVNLTDVELSDPLLEGDFGTLLAPTESINADGVLEIGESWTWQGAYTVQQDDIEDENGTGDIENTASVSVAEIEGEESASAAVPIDRSRSYEISKTVVSVAGGGPENTISAAGQVIEYQIVVENTGNRRINDVVLSDPLLQGENGTLSEPFESRNPNGVLQPNETWTYIGSYTVQQADIDGNGLDFEGGFDGDGDIDNVASVTSLQLPEEISDNADVQILQIDGYAISKQVTGVNGEASAVTAAGDVVGYEIVVENLGNVTLSGVAVSDALLEGSNGSLSTPVESIETDGLLQVGETWTYVGSYTVQQSDIDDNGGGDGDIDNSATVIADGLDPLDDSAAVPIVRSPSYTITKTVTDVGGNGPAGTVGAAGEVITYEIVVQNDGNTSLTNVAVTDPLAGPLGAPVQTGGTGSNVDAILDVGETWTYTASYTVDQSDIDAGGIDANGNPDGDGNIDNTATVSSNEADDESASEDVAITLDPAYTITKTVTGVLNPDGSADTDGVVDEKDDLIQYQILVANTGNQSLTGVTVSDPLLGGTLSGPTESGTANSILDVGETWTYSGSYSVQQSDIDNGGIDSEGNPDGDGDIDNRATVTSGQLGPESDDAAVPIEGLASYAITKTVVDVGGDGPGGIVDAAGDRIDYQIVVTNTGGLTITNVVLSDPLLVTPNGSLSGPTESISADGDLEVGETWTYTGSYTVQQTDIDNNGGGDGDIDNTATVMSSTLPMESDSAAVRISRAPAYSIVKNVIDVDGAGANGTVDAVGDVIRYEILVTNEGNLGLSGVSVSDPLLQGAGNTLSGPAESLNADGILEVGETWRYLGSYTVRQEDIDSNGSGDGAIDNTATVRSPVLADRTASASVAIEADADYTLETTIVDVGGGGPDAAIGDTDDVVTYASVVRNTGNQSLTGVTLSASLFGTEIGAPVEEGGTGTNGDGILDPGEFWTFTSTYTPSQFDIDSNGLGDGFVENTTTVNSVELFELTDTVSVALAQNPSLVIEKIVTDVDGEGPDGVVDEARDEISYTIVVRNDGNQTLTGVEVFDNKLEGRRGTISEPMESIANDGVLEVGESLTVMGTYRVRQRELENNGGGDGTIDNTARVVADQIDGPVRARASVEIAQLPQPTIDLDKNAIPLTTALGGPSAVIDLLAPFIDEFVEASGGSISGSSGPQPPLNTLFAGWFGRDYQVFADDVDNPGEPGTIGEMNADANYDFATLQAFFAPFAGKSSILYEYTVTNPGAGALDFKHIVDDNGTPGDNSDNFKLFYDDLLSGDTDGDGLLDPGETWTFGEIVTGPPLERGEAVTNIARVKAHDAAGELAKDSSEVTVARPVPVEIFTPQAGDQCIIATDGVADVIRVRAEQPGDDFVVFFNLEDGDRLDFRGDALKQVDTDNGSIRLFEEEQFGDLSIRMDRDGDGDGEELIKICEFFEINDQFLENRGIDRDDFTKRLPNDVAAEVLALITDDPDTWLA